jgi:thioredoxin reductase
MLGRCRRRVLLCDGGPPRNARSRAIHGYLTRDGTAPAEFLRLARAELKHYPSIEVRSALATDARIVGGGFRLTLEGGPTVGARKLLLATGVADELPELEGLDPLYGTSVHHCPYCDAWEWRDQPIAAYGRGDAASGLALALTTWSADVVLYSDGPAELDETHRDHLAEAGVEVCETPIVRLEGRDGLLERVVLVDGSVQLRRALLFAGGQHQRSSLAEDLGCQFNHRGTVDTGSCEATNVPGLYVAGDASKEAQFVVVAAAEGTEAGMAIHKALIAEGIHSRSRNRPTRPNPVPAAPVSGCGIRRSHARTLPPAQANPARTLNRYVDVASKMSPRGTRLP